MFFWKTVQLQKQLTKEMKNLAKVEYFPSEDAKVIGDLLTAYNNGDSTVDLQMAEAMSTLKKYPELLEAWDQLLMKYKKQGLFPKWKITT